MLLQISKITFEKSENLEKNPHKSESGYNFNRNLLFFFSFFLLFFLNCPGGNSISKS